MNTTKSLTAADLEQQLAALQNTISEKESRLAELLAAAQQCDVDALVSGKPGSADAIRKDAADLQVTVEHLKQQSAVHTAALQRLKQDEELAAKKAEAARIADLTQQYRQAVVDLIKTLNGRSRDALHQAHSHMQSLYARFPERGRPAGCPWIDNADALISFRDRRDTYIESVCHAGFADLIDDGELGKRRFLHQRAHDDAERERHARRQAASRKLADASVLPDELPLIPGRGGRVTYQ